MGLRKLLAPFAATAVLAAPALSAAQTAGLPVGQDAARYGYSTQPPVSFYELRRIAYDQGYREGLRHGEQDARRSERYDYDDEREFRDADRGYNRSYGDRERYRQVFRDGFTSGYSEGYSRVSNRGQYRGPGVSGQRGPYSGQRGYGTWGGSYGSYRGGYYSPAFDYGVREGYEKGAEDARKNRSFDPRRHSWYRDGDRHYEDEYGSRDQYKDVYRRGFQQGYEQGVREARYW